MKTLKTALITFLCVITIMICTALVTFRVTMDNLQITANGDGTYTVTVYGISETYYEI